MSKYLDSAGLTRVWAKIKAMFAPLASPSLTGTPTAPTAAEGTNTTQIATTAFVKTAVTSATITVDSALSSSSTNPVQNKVINTALGNKANLASPTFTGTPKAPTAATSTNNTQIATTAFVKAAITAAAPTIDTAMSDSSTNAVQNKIIKSYVDGKISTAYKAAGSLTGSALVASLLVAANEGNVYNISTGFTTTSNFVEGAGNSYPAGTNVVVINNGTTASPSYKFDVLAGMVDLSAYATTRDVQNTLNGHMPAVVYLPTENQGRTTDDYQGGGPVVGELFFCNDTANGGDGNVYVYGGSSWTKYTGDKLIIPEDSSHYTDVGADADYVLASQIYAYDQGDDYWVNILSIFPDKQDLNEVISDVSDHAADIVSLQKRKLDRAELFFYYLDSAHQTTSAPSTSTAKTGQYYYNTNTDTMYRFNGTSWVAYTGDGFFMLGGENQSMGENSSILYPNDIIYYNSEVSIWVHLSNELTSDDSLLNNVVRPIGRTGTPASTGHTFGRYYIYKDTIGGNTVLTLYVGNANGSPTAVTSTNKLFLYDGMVYQFISGTGEGTGLQPVGHVESITDAEIDTICV